MPDPYDKAELKVVEQLPYLVRVKSRCCISIINHFDSLLLSWKGSESPMAFLPASLVYLQVSPFSSESGAFLLV